MSVEIFVGAEKLVIDNLPATEVELGDDTVESVIGYFTNNGNGVEDVQTIVLEFTPSEANYDYDVDSNEYNFLEMGEAITDPVLGTFSVFFESASQDLTKDKELVEVSRSSDELRIKFTNLAGNEYTLVPLKNDDLNILSGDNFNSTGLSRTEARKSKFILNKEISSGYATHIAEISNVEMDGSNIVSITLSYAGTNEKVNVGSAIRRSKDNLYVCHAGSGDAAVKTGVTIQEGACLYDGNATYYDGGFDSIYAANKITIDLSTSGKIVLDETHDDAGAEVLSFDYTWDGTTDKEYTVKPTSGGTFNATGNTYDDGDFGAYLTRFGSYIEHEADEDSWVKIYTPKERTTYNVFVATDVSSETPSETGKLTVLDSESSAYAGKNLIVVGGSAVNSVAASLLGLTGDARFGEGFTAKTSIVSGEALIEAFDHDGKVALLVAGYDAADTTKAASYLTSGAAVSTDLGTKLRVTSQTEAVAITA